ncbi:NAD+ diphosphatase [Loktanella fryxellensis]|uniref:NAD(+) diphosphatase n=1 Tax=Loktanella fryxellensis TaxID=245187 RepID=A0A1H8AZE9_9RHOB|nr:NAD(+) diphosphatase [Loktanella fryxellensis]SEM74887.1 NAD+ diphosphatase [Loktanella fryxellensis]
MNLAETVTFGGGRLNRAAHLRGDAALPTSPDSRIIVLWRGKPLIDRGGLVRLTPDHPMLADAGPNRVLLGLVDGTPLSAADLSRWIPDGDDAPVDGFADTTRQVHPTLPEGPAFAELRSVMTDLSPLDAELAATARALVTWHGSHGFCANCGAATAMAQGGWQRNCAPCGRHHFPRTDPVVIMLVTHGNSVLVGRSPGWPAGMYSLLAGFVEPGETLEAAVRREVFEETGVRVGPVRYLASQPWPFPASLMCGMAGEATSTAITIDPVEIEDARWVTREEMADVFAGLHPDIRPARPGAIAHHLLHGWLADRLD